LLGAAAAAGSGHDPEPTMAGWEAANTHGSSAGTKSVAGYGGVSGGARAASGSGKHGPGYGHRRSLAGATAAAGSGHDPEPTMAGWEAANTHGSSSGTKSVAGYGGVNGGARAASGSGKHGPGYGHRRSLTGAVSLIAA
jgi:hypothetical protein